MTVGNATKALTRKGWTVKNEGRSYTAAKEGNVYEISFWANGGDSLDTSVVCLKVRRYTDVSDIQSDYFAGSFAKSIPQALRYADDVPEVQS